MSELINDVRHAVRGLLRTPVSTATLVVTLSLGIGANTAVFSVLNGVLLAPLPYDEPEELITVAHELTRIDGVGRVGIPGPDLLDYIEGAPSIESMGWVAPLETNLTDDQGAARITIGWTTPDFFPTLGATAAAGRMLDPADWTPRTRAQMEDPAFQPPPMPVMLSYGLWRSRFGADPEIVGRSLIINGTAMSVIGVLSPDFRIHLPPDAGVPSTIDAFSYMPIPLTEGQRGAGGGIAVARLAEGATRERAQAELEAVNRQLHTVWSAHERFGTRIVTAPLFDEVVGPSRALLWTLFGAIGLVLLVAVANVANLLLVRAQARHHEFATRIALGASRRRIVQKLLTESLVVGALGAAAGLGLAVLGVDLLGALAPLDLPRLDQVELNATVLTFTAFATLGATLLFGAAPALTGARVRGSQLVSSRGQVGTGRSGLRLRNALIAAEIALSVVLVAGTGLLVRSFAGLSRVDAGYDPGRALAVEMALPFFSYRDLGTRQAFFSELRRRAGELPGVRVAGISPALPLTDGGGTWSAAYSLKGDIGEETTTRVRYRTASVGYFDALGARIVEGRAFAEADVAGAGTPGRIIPVVVDRSFAAGAWPGASPLDRTLRITVAAYIGTGRTETARVVGVVDDMRHRDLATPDEPTLWIPFDEYAPLEGVLVLRGGFDRAATLDGVRTILRSLDPGVPIYNVRTLADDLAAATARQRYALVLLGLFAATALLLAAVGLYGVISTSVQQRTREIGLRLAVGADGEQIGRMVLGQGLRLVALGLGLGIAASTLTTPVLDSLLYGVSTVDPLTLTATAILLGAVALAAAWVPAARAGRLDPVEALRVE
ncbi:MAG: FtsX-like permease family protein [Gemmatimonadetes bacterium]|nr:MAG: FtsX-like permease family protein [Gemmatimonadota bacterium]